MTFDYSSERCKIEHIIVTERYCRDMGRWEKMRSFWHPESTETSVKITWFDGTVDDYIEGSRTLTDEAGFINVKYLINPADVTIYEGRAMCEAYGTINGRPTLDGIEYDMSISATFLAKLVQLEGMWKIVSLECLYDKDSLVPVATRPMTPLDVKYSRESYKFLAYVLETVCGYKIDPDLPGFDRPEEVQTLFKDARDWVYGYGI